MIETKLFEVEHDFYDTKEQKRYSLCGRNAYKNILKEAQGFWLKEIWLVIKWIGMARDWVFKAINEVGLIDLLYIKETTPIQFGWVKGIRPKRN